MKIFAIFCTVLFFVVDISCNQSCKSVTCPPIPKHYEEFGCKPIIENDKCCPTYFNCSNMENRDLTKCHLSNETFAVGDELHNADIEASCTVGCRCRESRSDKQPSFECAHIDCPEFFGGNDETPGKKCIRQYDPKGCCSKNKVCGEDLNKLAKCEFNGQTYYEGQKIDVDSKCYSCFCEKGFEDKPVEENKNCHKINCNIELHYSARISKGCVPIYYKSDDCCPIQWRCPDETTTVVSDSSRKSIESDQKCTFGKLKMNIGDYLSPEDDYDQCTICSCSLPPLPHCIKTC